MFYWFVVESIHNCLIASLYYQKTQYEKKFYAKKGFKHASCVKNHVFDMTVRVRNEETQFPMFDHVADGISLAKHVSINEVKKIEKLK